MRILLSILFAVLIVNADSPHGTIVTQSVTINSAYVSETATHFLLQFKVPRVGIVASNCDSAKHVAFTSTTDTVRIPRWVLFTTDTLFVYADVAKSSSVNTSYNLHYGKTLSEINSASTFTNCGISYYYGMEQTSLPVVDYASGVNLTGGTSWTSGKGIFNNAVISSVSTDINTTDISIFSGKTAFTYNAIFNPSTVAGDNIFFAYRTAAGNIGFQIYYNPTRINVYAGAATNYGQFSTALTTSTYYMITVVYDGSQSTNANRLKLYVNGDLKTLAFTGTIPASIPTISGALVGNGIDGTSIASPVCTIDEQFIRSAAATQGTILDRYNMLFNQSSFLTLGTPALNQVIGNAGIDTIVLTCSAENADSYQWYLDNAPIDGATDSTLIVIADSTFYSTKHEIYCLVTNEYVSVICGTWRYGDWSANRSRWDAFIRPFKDAFKRAFK